MQDSFGEITSDVTRLDLETNPASGISSIAAHIETELDVIDEAVGSANVASVIESTRLKARNGRHLSSLNEFIALLSTLGLDGPVHLRSFNLRTSATRIGSGSQFTVYKRQSGLGGTNEVWKRVNLPLVHENNKDIIADPSYRAALRHLESETLSLSDLRLRKHRNIVKLLGWALDYDDRRNGTPVLRMEAAHCTLSSITSNSTSSDNSNLSTHDWKVRYHLALDIAAGLQAIHSCNIAHGDVKPDNILVFQHDDPKVPFIAKLGDFGVALDIRDSSLTSNSFYRGTKSWTGPEVDMSLDEYRILFGTFEPWHFQRFDSFSYGMVLVALFATDATVLFGSNIQEKALQWEQAADAARVVLAQLEGLPKRVFTTLQLVVQKCLQKSPLDRPLPSPNLLQSDTEIYKDWLVSALQFNGQEFQEGMKDYTLNRGPIYWSHLDEQVAKQLYSQLVKNEFSSSLSNFSGSTLIGLAQKFALLRTAESRDKISNLLLLASRQGHIPAQAICERVFEAQKKPLPENENTRKSWYKAAVLTGYLFHDQKQISPLELCDLRMRFRRRGGYCTDSFLKNLVIVRAVNDPARLEAQIGSSREQHVVDTDGNTWHHVCAAVGSSKCLQILLGSAHLLPPTSNYHGETALYKACQAGNFEALSMLVNAGLRTQNVTGAVCEAHWLFNFEHEYIHTALELLIQAGVDINQRFNPSGDHTRSPMLSRHFPFAWPLGTPMHWAVYARNKAAASALAQQKALIDAPASEKEPHNTPLMQAISRGDDDMVRLLLKLGANPLVQGKKGRNILHLMSPVFGHQDHPSSILQVWIRHGSRENALLANISIIEQLIACGIQVDSRHTDYDEETPLLQALAAPDDIVAYALLACNANANVTSLQNNEDALHKLISKDYDALVYPEGYFPLLQILAQRRMDINALRGTYDGTVMHAAMRNSMEPNRLRHFIEMLKKNSAQEVNMNAFDRNGETALMRAVTATDSCDKLKRQIRVLFDFGAHPRFTNEHGENVLTALLMNFHLMDAETNELINMLTRNPHFQESELAQFIQHTNPSCLGIACSEAKLQTTITLLNLGMIEKLNSPISSRNNSNMTALSHAFYGADAIRCVYYRQMSYYLTKAQLEQAEAFDSLYSYNDFGQNTAGQPSVEREKERYWNSPGVLKLLQSLGGTRTPIDASNWETEPSFQDARSLPELGLLESQRPHQAHWQPLFDLELLGEGWEDECLSLIKDWYSDTELMIPPVLLFDRWPQVLDVLKPTEANWYKALNQGAHLVEVEMVDGKVQGVRDWYTKKPVKKRWSHDLPAYRRNNI